MGKDKTFCIFGDSVTQAAYVRDSWVNLLTEFLEDKYKESFVNVFNLGIGGNTSQEILKRFEFESSVRGPTEIIFAFGVNDSGYLFTPDKPIVTEKEFEENIKNLINLAKKLTTNITFVGPVIGDDSILKPFPGSSTGKSYDIDRVKKYNSILKETSVTNGCKFIELWSVLSSEDFDDGLHPNEKGHRKMFEQIKNYF